MEENGNMHMVHRRSKRQRHAEKVTMSNWGEPVWCPLVDSVVRTENRDTTETTILTVMEPDRSNSQRSSGQGWRYSGIRCNAESQYVNIQEVGDGHSSEDREDNITSQEQRAISLNIFLKKYIGRRRMA
jgi:hypothetical protein